MAGTTYKRGVNWAHCNWTTGTVTALLLNTFPNSDFPGFQTIDDIVSNGWEFTDSAYARQTLAGPPDIVFTDGFPGQTSFTGDAIDFGILVDGGEALGLVLAGDTGTPSTSPLIVAFELIYEANAVDAATFQMPGYGWFSTWDQCNPV